MIGKLKGIIDSTDDDSLILETGGVGYHVFCSVKTLAGLRVGEAVQLVIETHVREDHIHLFGFSNTMEREWFRLLTTVQGVGVKMALAVLSVFTPGELNGVIAARDTRPLTRVSGVGTKLAERLTTELKNKIAKMPSGTGTAEAKAAGLSALPPASVNEDGISALVNLGYARSEAYQAVAKAAVRLGSAEYTLDSLIKESLRELMK